MTHASLCTGIGACEIAAAWLGWNNAFSCEINEFCQHVLKYYYPNSKHYENIFGTDFTTFRGKIDVLTAGFPCQPFSCAGSRKGAQDDRYLWPEVLRVIDEIKPTWFIGENVAGITSMVLPSDEIEVGSYKDIFGESYQETEMREQFVVERICRDLEDIGYSVQPVIIPACAVGAPHRRDRVWFIANTIGKRCNNGGDYRQKRQFCIDKERYSKKNKSERTKRKCWISKNGETFTNSTGERLEDRFRFKGWTHEKEAGTRVDCEHKRHGCHEYASNAEKFNGNIPRFHSGKLSQQQASRISVDTNTYCERCKKHHTSKESGLPEFSRFVCKKVPSWCNFPTQSPVCCGNDGLPDKLFDITVSRWTTEAIKAFGNTMVPQVVLEIFKAIEATHF